MSGPVIRIFDEASLSEKERSDCLAVAKEAFTGYVMFLPFEEHAADGPAFFDAFIKSWVNGCLDGGICLLAEAGGEAAGTIVMRPPGAPEAEVIDPESEEGKRAVAAAGRENYEKFVNFCVRAEAGCAGLKVPNWYISLLAVRPSYQGKGVGRALLDAAAAYASEHSPEGKGLLTLCTSSVPNCGYYKANGFEVFDEVMIPTGYGGELGSWSFRKKV